MVKELDSSDRFRHRLASIESKMGDSDSATMPKSLSELILRPMSAKLLKPTFVENMGWVDRSRLLDISGRGRDRQLKMAKDYGWRYFEKPGGGCLLTETSVSMKIKDLSSHRDITIKDSNLFKYGRYLVLKDGGRCVISRNEVENEKLSISNPNMELIELIDCIGPVGLIEKSSSREDKILSARLTLTYGKSDPKKSYMVKIGEESLELAPFESRDTAQQYLLIK